jgi:hypothetical protein
MNVSCHGRPLRFVAWFRRLDFAALRRLDLAAARWLDLAADLPNHLFPLS